MLHHITSHSLTLRHLAHHGERCTAEAPEGLRVLGGVDLHGAHQLRRRDPEARPPTRPREDDRGRLLLNAEVQRNTFIVASSPVDLPRR